MRGDLLHLIISMHMQRVAQASRRSCSETIEICTRAWRSSCIMRIAFCFHLSNFLQMRLRPACLTQPGLSLLHVVGQEDTTAHCRIGGTPLMRWRGS